MMFWKMTAGPDPRVRRATWRSEKGVPRAQYPVPFLTEERLFLATACIALNTVNRTSRLAAKNRKATVSLSSEGGSNAAGLKSFRIHCRQCPGMLAKAQGESVEAQKRSD
jgi:hypothetical protein